MADLAEICTIPAKRKRHLARWLEGDKHAPRKPGRSGRTLCGNSAMDEERANDQIRRHGGHKRLVVAVLPVCAACCRIADLPTEETPG